MNAGEKLLVLENRMASLTAAKRAVAAIGRCGRSIGKAVKELRALAGHSATNRVIEDLTDAARHLERTANQMEKLVDLISKREE